MSGCGHYTVQNKPYAVTSMLIIKSGQIVNSTFMAWDTGLLNTIYGSLVM